MFTGLITDIGKITAIRKNSNDARVEIESGLYPFTKGESIAVNGACLTVETFTKGTFTVFASAETLRLTGMETLKTGSKVNLERAMSLGDRLDGHLVSGHVDTRVKLTSKTKSGEALRLQFELPDENLLKSQISSKGSIAIDGISLTVNDVNNTSFTLMLIPETIKNTTLSSLDIGDLVNIETDIIAKYVTRFLTVQSGKSDHNDNKSSDKNSALNMNFLQENGFVR
ncbi:MAG: riboflavin synthase [Deltaproteobacteria bacterium]|nr:riboflavin synthase [Deltaproteobacteria bacterium]